MLSRIKVLRILAAVAIGLLLAILIGTVRALPPERIEQLSTGMAGIGWLFGGAALLILTAIALVFWWRPRVRTLVIAAAILAATGATAAYLFRIEGFYGNLVPLFVWRSSPTAEQQFTDYLESQKKADERAASNAVPVKLVETPHDYSGFLGPNRDGHVHGVRLARDWQAHPPKELWRHPVGLGWGSFAIVGDFAFTQEQRGSDETVVCYELRTGRERWAHGDPVRFSGSHGHGPRATPTVAAGRVYTMGGTGLVNCLDASNGRVVWQKNMLPVGSEPGAGNLLWGMAGSPLVLGDEVIVTPGGGPGRSVVALNCSDGSPAWSGGDDPAAYASPILAEIAGVPQIVSFQGAGLAGYEWGRGALLWRQPWVTQGEQMVNVAQPLAVEPFGPPGKNERFFAVSSGYGVGAGLFRVAFEKNEWRVSEIWRNKLLRSKLSNFVAVGNCLYGLDDGTLACLDLKTGQRLWRDGRYGHGQILRVDDLLLIQAESGEIALVEPAPSERREVARLTALDDKTWNHPALAGNVLLVRNDRDAAAFELPTEKIADLPLVSLVHWLNKHL